MQKLSFLLILMIVFFWSCNSNNSGYKPDTSTYKSPKGTDVFKPDSASIAENYVIPEWFKDAKLGIFIHWGVYAVPGFQNEWYPRNIYQEGSKVYEHHV